MLPDNRPYLIGETAFHHQGDIAYLKAMIDAAALSQCDAIKFHLLFDPEDYMVADHRALSSLRKLIIDQPGWEELAGFLDKYPIDKIFLCNDTASLKWINQGNLDVKAIEIHATGINDIFLLEEATKFGGTVILGTGGSSLDEIKYAIEFLKERGKQDIFLMHGFQHYPTDHAEIVFSKMKLLKELFGLPVGYADHTAPQDPLNPVISVLPLAQGFNVVEKHFTISYGEKRIDAQSAISLDSLKELKLLMSEVYKTFGTNPLHMSDSELKYGDTGPMKKAIVARRYIPKGQIIHKEDVAFKRTNTSSYIRQFQWPLIVGTKATEAIRKDQIIDFSMVNYHKEISDFSQFNHK